MCCKAPYVNSTTLLFSLTKLYFLFLLLIIIIIVIIIIIIIIIYLFALFFFFVGGGGLFAWLSLHIFKVFPRDMKLVPCSH